MSHRSTSSLCFLAYPAVRTDPRHLLPHVLFAWRPFKSAARVLSDGGMGTALQVFRGGSTGRPLSTSEHSQGNGGNHTQVRVCVLAMNRTVELSITYVHGAGRGIYAVVLRNIEDVVARQSQRVAHRAEYENMGKRCSRAATF